MNKETFCAAPWFNVRNDNDGTLKPCTCIKLDDSYNINSHSIEEWRNSPAMQTLRKEHANGNKPKSCETCWGPEKLGLESRRLQYNKIIGLDWIELYLKHHTDYKTSLTLASELKIGNKCNLECAMCSPEFSSKIAKTWNENPSLEFTKIINSKAYQNPLLEKFMDKLFTHPIKFVNVFGGEPLLEKRLINKLLQLEDKHNIDLNFITNGTFNIKEYNNKLKEFKSVHFGISIDAVGEVNDFIRKGSAWNTVKENLLDNDNTHIICTVQALNIEHIPELIKFANKHNKRLQLISLFDPDYLSLDAVQPEVLKKITDKELQPFIKDAHYKPALREKFKRYMRWFTKKP